MNVKTLEGKVFPVKNGQTILEAANLAGLNLEYSCNSGQCGVCVTNLLQGKVVEKKPQLSLSDLDREQNRILTCCCEPTTDILIDAEDLAGLKGIDIKVLPVRIKDIQLLVEDIIEMTLRFPATAIFRYLEGQYIDVIGPNQLRRSYSIASTSNEAELKLLIKRFENGAMSEYWFNQAKVNDLLRIEGPKGTFFIRDKSVDLIFLATGTGIAPVMSILKSLDQEENLDTKSSIKVYWGNCYPEQFVWQPDFTSINVEWVPVLSRENNEWNGEVGYVQDIALSRVDKLKNIHVYACGSNLMIKSAKEIFIKKGLEDKCFYSDAFVQSY